jgi:hypothetical protein
LALAGNTEKAAMNREKGGGAGGFALEIKFLDLYIQYKKGLKMVGR